jgi:hypothetical protein
MNNDKRLSNIVTTHEQSCAETIITVLPHFTSPHLAQQKPSPPVMISENYATT